MSASAHGGDLHLTTFQFISAAKSLKQSMHTQYRSSVVTYPIFRSPGANENLAQQNAAVIVVPPLSIWAPLPQRERAPLQVFLLPLSSPVI